MQRRVCRIVVCHYECPAVWAYRPVGGNAAGLVSSSSTVITIGTGIGGPSGVALDGSGHLFTANLSDLTVKEIDLNPFPVLSFANTSVGSTSSTQSVLVQNVGNTALTFPIPGSGQNPSQSPYFALSSSSTCPQVSSSTSLAGTLAAGTSCTEVISYSPAISGAVTGNLIFTDNSLNTSGSTQTLVETGATSASLTVSVVSQTVASGTGSIALEFTGGWGGNVKPTGTATLTVNGSAINVGTINCTAKSGHSNCTASYNPSGLNPGNYPITATQGTDSTYTTPASATGTLTVTGSAPHIDGPVRSASLSEIAPAQLFGRD